MDEMFDLGIIAKRSHSFLQLKPDLPNWRNMDEMFDLGIIAKRSH